MRKFFLSQSVVSERYLFVVISVQMGVAIITFFLAWTAGRIDMGISYLIFAVAWSAVAFIAARKIVKNRQTIIIKQRRVAMFIEKTISFVVFVVCVTSLVKAIFSNLPGKVQSWLMPYLAFFAICID